MEQQNKRNRTFAIFASIGVVAVGIGYWCFNSKPVVLTRAETAKVAVATNANTPAAENMAFPANEAGNTDIYRAVHQSKLSKLSDAQQKYLQDRYDEFMDKEKQLEAKLAHREIVKPGEALITIPPHQEESKALYSDFETQVVSYLGADAAATFLNSVAPTISALNADFGANEQDILVDRDNGKYHIVDKVVYSSQVGLPASVTNSGITRTLVSDITVGSDLSTYKYLAADFP